MPIVTLRPTAEWFIPSDFTNYILGTVVGGSSRAEVLADNDLNTYIQYILPPSPTTPSTGLCQVFIEPFDFPRQQVVRWVRMVIEIFTPTLLANVVFSGVTVNASVINLATKQIKSPSSLRGYFATIFYLEEPLGNAGSPPARTSANTGFFPFRVSPWHEGAFDTFSCRIAIENKGTASADARIRGLRFEVLVNDPPSVIVTGPASPETTTSRPTVTFLYSDPNSDPQEAFQIKTFTDDQYLDPLFDENSTPAFWDSGTVLTDATSQQVGRLHYNGTYRAYVRATDTGANFVWGDWAFLEWTQAVSAPNPVDLVAVAEPSEARVHLIITGTADYVILERSDDFGVTWDFIGETSDAQVHDYFAPRDIPVFYRATNVDGDLASDPTITGISQLDRDNIIRLVSTTDPEALRMDICLTGLPIASDSHRAQGVFYPIGRPDPVVIEDTIRLESYSSLEFVTFSGTEFELFEAIRGTQAPIMFRTCFGDETTSSAFHDDSFIRFGATRGQGHLAPANSPIGTHRQLSLPAQQVLANPEILPFADDLVVSPSVCEIIPPDAITSAVRIDGSPVTAIQDDPDAPDGNWLLGQPQALAPDALTTQLNLTGSLSDIQDDPDSPDGNWLTRNAPLTTTSAIGTFATPAANPSGIQEFRFLLRTVDGPQTVSLRAVEGVNPVVVASFTVTSPTGEIASLTWDPALLANPSGADVGFQIVGTGSQTFELGAVEWNVQMVESLEVTFPTPALPPTGIQDIRVLARPTAGQTQARVRLLVDAPGAVVVPTNVIITAPTVVSISWDASGLTDPTGADVSLIARNDLGTAVGYFDIGAVEWREFC